MTPTVIRLACGHTLTLSALLVDTLSLRDMREGVAVILRGHYAAEHPPLLERARRRPMWPPRLHAGDLDPALEAETP